VMAEWMMSEPQRSVRRKEDKLTRIYVARQRTNEKRITYFHCGPKKRLPFSEEPCAKS